MPTIAADKLIYYRCWQRVALFADELSLVSLGGTCRILREVVNTAEVWELRIEDLHKAINQRREEGRFSSSDSPDDQTIETRAARQRQQRSAGIHLSVDTSGDAATDDSEAALDVAGRAKLRQELRVKRHREADLKKAAVAKEFLIQFIRRNPSLFRGLCTLNPLHNDLLATSVALSVSNHLKRCLLRYKWLIEHHWLDPRFLWKVTCTNNFSQLRYGANQPRFWNNYAQKRDYFEVRATLVRDHRKFAAATASSEQHEKVEAEKQHRRSKALMGQLDHDFSDGHHRELALLVEQRVHRQLAENVDVALLLFPTTRPMLSKLRTTWPRVLYWAGFRLFLHFFGLDPDSAEASQAQANLTASTRAEGQGRASFISSLLRYAVFGARIAVGYVQKVILEFPGPNPMGAAHYERKIDLLALAFSGYLGAHIFAPSLYNTMVPYSTTLPKLHAAVTFVSYYTVAACDSMYTTVMQKLSSVVVGLPVALLVHRYIKKDLLFARGCLINRSDIIYTAAFIGQFVPLYFWLRNAVVDEWNNDRRAAIGNIMTISMEFMLQTVNTLALRESWTKGLLAFSFVCALDGVWKCLLRALRGKN